MEGGPKRRLGVGTKGTICPLPWRSHGVGSAHSLSGVGGVIRNGLPSRPTLPPPPAKFEIGLGLGVTLCVLGGRSALGGQARAPGQGCGVCESPRWPRGGRLDSGPLLCWGNGKPPPLPLFSQNRSLPLPFSAAPSPSPVLLTSRGVGEGGGLGEVEGHPPYLCHRH